MIKANTIYNSDCIEGMKLIEDESVDFIIADPPYNLSNQKATLERSKYDGQLRDKYFGDWDMHFEHTSWLDEAYRILKKGGQMIIFNGFANFGEIIEYFSQYKSVEVKRQLVWSKPSPMPANRDRLYVNSMEFMIWIVKGRGWTFNRLKDNYETGLFEYPTPRGKIRVHPNQKPLGLIEELVQIHSNEGDLIVDPFMGSATTAVACINHNRNYIGFELEEEHFNNAKSRIEATKQAT